ncbi:MAG: hypothetical protein IJA25_03770 [Anaerotignum sp.]|nr:hypothetical protein [Anaerotignum sp.]MBQ3568029.1 hypothetical protein [Anaerotignum sp.]MBQ7102791.1 hypothetical protein [Anaerotignum sp.]
MSAKNKVIAGDYNGANIAMAANQVVLNISLGNMIILNKKMVASHKVESESKGTHTVSVTFADGKKSLMELDDKMCKALLSQLF